MNVSGNDQVKEGGGERKRAFTPARIVALVVIGLVMLALGYVHVSSGDDAVSVPSGAKAGDLTLDDCQYATEQGNYAADCGTLVVPENRHKADSRLIALPVTRIRARSADPGGADLPPPGRPGNHEHDLPDGEPVRRQARRRARRLPRRRRLVEARLSRGRHRRASRRAASSPRRRCAPTRWRTRTARSASRTTGVDLAGYTLPQRVDDLDAARKALGYERVDLLSESAGTRTAMIYAWRYPQRIHRSVMIGANPPGNFLWDAKTTGEQIERYAALCANDASCRSRTPDLAASIHSAYDEIPGRWWFLPIRKGNVQLGAFWGLMHATTDGAGPLNGAVDDRHAPRRRQGRRQRGVVLLPDDPGDLPARAGVGGRRRLRPGRRRPRPALLRVPRRPRIGDRQPRHRLPHGGRPALRLVAGEPGRERVHPRPGLERRDAPDRRQARRGDAAPERDARAAAAPAERQGGRAAGHRPHGRLLDLPDAGKQPADQHVPRQRPGRHVALHADLRRLHARTRSRPDRGDRPRRDAGAGRVDGALAGLDGAPRAMARSVRTQEQRACSAPCTRSCSAWEGCSSAC